MKTLGLERSTGECRGGDWVEHLALDGVTRLVIGTGPGSFAGIRSAIAFAQGYRLGRPEVEVFGLPSPCAIAAECDLPALAVVGDARQGKAWIALFEAGVLTRPVFQVEADALASWVPAFCAVASPDDRRIGNRLRELFGERYLGERLPSAEGLVAYAEAHAEALQLDPLPIYLNPAVRN